MQRALETAHGPGGRAEHRCWVYDDPSTFRRRALEFLSAGAAAGYRVQLLGNADMDTLHAQFAQLPGFAMLRREHDLAVRSLSDQYGIDEVVDPDAPVAAYTAATEDAVAQGYAGLCVVADATALVRTPEQREAFARYEHLIDRSMTQQPFTAMCAYDASVLGHDAVAEIACLHPVVDGASPGFQWYASTTADMCLAGEVDVASQQTFGATIARTVPLLAGQELVVDASTLGFIDHRGLLTLEEHAQRCGVQVRLVGDLPMAQRLTQLLELQAVRFEAAA